MRVSIDGGAQVRWNPNGQRIVLYRPGWPAHGSFNPLRRQTTRPSNLVLRSRCSPRAWTATASLRYRQQYAVSPDGQSFVMHSVVGEASSSPITVILNWKPAR